MDNRSIYERTDDDLVRSGRVKGTIRYDFIFIPLLKIFYENKDAGGLSKEKIYAFLEKKMHFNEAEKRNRIQLVRKDKDSDDFTERDMGISEYAYKTNWALTFLKKAGYILADEDKKFKITEEGQEFIEHNNLKDSEQIDRLEYKKLRKDIISLAQSAGDQSEDDDIEIEKADMKYEDYIANGQIEFITFHPSYCYEDFVEGIRPSMGDSKAKKEDDKIKFELKEGIFKRICARALHAAVTGEIKKDVKWNDAYDLYRTSIKNTDINFKDAPKFVLIIDEINRGDVSKIFGELITLIEEDKRLAEGREIIAKLPYSNDAFSVPSNLYLIGTMNTADRSLALIDVALRRRFDFEEIKPDPKAVLDDPAKYKSIAVKDDELFKKSIMATLNLNKELGENEDIGKDKKIGHAFFCNLKSRDDILKVWKNKIFPLLEEYYFFDRKELADKSKGAYSFIDGWYEDKIEPFINGWAKGESDE